jgi:hypothetical protein
VIDDPLAAALAEIGALDGTPALSLLSEAKRAARKGYAPQFGEQELDAADNAVIALDHARLRLLAALDAVLKAHRNAGGRCAWCRNPDGQRQKWPCGEYLAIARELTGKGNRPTEATRPRTPEVRNPDGSHTMTIQRCCNGCGDELGDATDRELECAVSGEPLPDVRNECPACRQATGISSPGGNQ